MWQAQIKLKVELRSILKLVEVQIEAEFVLKSEGGDGVEKLTSKISQLPTKLKLKLELSLVPKIKSNQNSFGNRFGTFKLFVSKCPNYGNGYGVQTKAERPNFFVSIPGRVLDNVQFFKLRLEAFIHRSVCWSVLKKLPKKLQNFTKPYKTSKYKYE